MGAAMKCRSCRGLGVDLLTGWPRDLADCMLKSGAKFVCVDCAGSGTDTSYDDARRFARDELDDFRRTAGDNRRGAHEEDISEKA